MTEEKTGQAGLAGLENKS